MKLALTLATRLALATLLALAACHRDVDLRPPDDGGADGDAGVVTDATWQADAELPDAGP